jgi:hypothetical protein
VPVENKTKKQIPRAVDRREKTVRRLWKDSQQCRSAKGSRSRLGRKVHTIRVVRNKR